MNMELEIQGQAANDPKPLAGQHFGMGYFPKFTAGRMITAKMTGISSRKRKLFPEE
jgi:hypothetical protein